MTQEPLADIEFFGETVLHLWIHALTYILRIAAHLRCGHLVYEETADIIEDCEMALKEIQQVLSMYSYC